MQSNKKIGKVENESSKSLLKTGIKYLGIALPLLFLAPILITIGFKSLKKDSSFLYLIIGIIIAFITIGLVVQGFRFILKSLFKNET